MKRFFVPILALVSGCSMRGQTPLTPTIPKCINTHGTLGAPYVLMVIPSSSADPNLSQQILCVQIEGTSLAVAKVVFPDGTTGWTLRAITSAVAFPEIISSETPAGVNDGVQTGFTLANIPVAGSLHIYVNGMVMTPDVDYKMLDARNIQFTIPPPPQSIIRATYWK